MDISDARDVHDFAENELGLDVEVRSRRDSKSQIADYTYFMEALRAGELKHSGDPGLTRHVLNATVRIMPLGDAVFARPGLSRNDERRAPRPAADRRPGRRRVCEHGRRRRTRLECLRRARPDHRLTQSAYLRASGTAGLLALYERVSTDWPGRRAAVADRRLGRLDEPRPGSGSRSRARWRSPTCSRPSTSSARRSRSCR